MNEIKRKYDEKINLEKKQVKNINDDRYEKTDKSYTDTLTNKEIINYLEDYKAVINLDELMVGEHVRYIDLDIKKFRLGGSIIKIDVEYIVLTNGCITWSVQKTNKIFFKKIQIKDIRQEYETIIEQYKKVIKDKEQELINVITYYKNRGK